jgi:oxalate decarboxylase/phosphoglucose isomerase-like protein (cupin superfamily)
MDIKNAVHIINLPKIEDERGNLSFIEEQSAIPFKLSRTYWIYDVPGGEHRGGHAFKEAEEFIVCLSGSLEVLTFDGISEKRFSLSRSYYGLYVPCMTWRTLENFSTNSLALVLSSTAYKKADYIRDYNLFLQLKAGINE